MKLFWRTAFAVFPLLALSVGIRIEVLDMAEATYGLAVGTYLMVVIHGGRNSSNAP